MKYYDSFLSINNNPKQKWYDSSVQLQQMQFDDSYTVWDDIEEETEFGTLDFQVIRARVTTIIDVKTGQRNGDNYRKIIFYDCTHRPVTGTRYRFDNNIWIVFATKNLKVSSSSVYVYRCNNTLNTQDKYGNIHREPCYVDYKINETQLIQGELIDVPNGRLNLVCQVNQWTRDLDVGKRFIIGKDVYKIRYRAKYERNNTFDEDSVTVAQFYINYDNKQENDNFDLQIADYIKNEYSISCDDSITNVINHSGYIPVKVIHNGEEVEEPVIFSSEDSQIINITEDGNYVMLSQGSTRVLVKMKNNESCFRYIDITVSEQAINDIQIIPDIRKIKLNQTVSYQIISNSNVDVEVTSDNPPYYYKYNKTGENTFDIKNMKQSNYPVSIICTSGNIVKRFDITLGGLI